MFSALVPKHYGDLSKELQRESSAFQSQGVLLNILLVCRLLPPGFVDGLRAYKGIRNKIAHNLEEPFNLAIYREKLTAIFQKIGNNADAGINRIAIETVVNEVVEHLMSSDLLVDSSGEKILKSRQDALEAIHGSRTILDHLQEVSLRAEIGIGVGVMIGTIIHHRDKLLSILGDSGTVLKLFSDIENSGINNEGLP